MEEAWQNVDGFYALMYQLCQCRRNIVASLLKGDAVEHELLVSLEKVRNKIVTAVKGDFVLTLTADNGKSMHLNVKDELLGIEKDLCFLGCMKSGSSGSKYFVDCLARYHPKSVETFHEEVAFTERMLKRIMSAGLGVFITDWDGTMKTYCSNYRTSVQPVYSAYWLSGFAKLCGSLCAVLTAGPLGDFGILNLVAVPVEQTNVIFGGSWGREWLINNHRHVDRTAVTENGEEHLNKLTQCLLKLIHERTDFHRFLMTGSGFQRKVDRITIGFQTVSGEVTDQERTAFLDAVMTAVRTIDADDKIFSVRHEKLDIEVVLRTVQGCWTKGDGVRYLLKETGKSLAADVVWICGDTTSDLPMLDFALQANPKNTYATFVNPCDEIRSTVTANMAPDHYTFVGCPEVLHAAMESVMRENGLRTI
uniref:T6PP_N domain-containing protein n=1 Tax=Trichuris muris TaxID=70415 RepID=A0A5S6QYK5_TRIMR